MNRRQSRISLPLIAGVLWAGAPATPGAATMAPGRPSVPLSGAVPSPAVAGPVPATASPGDSSHDYPFFATDQDLRELGHVEEEYFIEGTANRYTTPDGATGTVTDDSLSYDVFSQAAQALRHPEGVDPLAGLKVRTLIATGRSQSASRLATYANSVHPIAPVYDAIALVDGGVQIRPDLTTRVFKTASEYDVLTSQAARRQPDTARYVYGEIAGASHSDRHAFLVNNRIRLRDAGVSGLLAGPTAPCVLPARSNVPYEYVLDAMFDHIVAWVRDGTQPPAGPRVEITDFATQPVTAARDPYQIVRGGIRLAAVDVPTERNAGWNTGLIPADNSRCAQGGAWVPFDGATLHALYPTHRSYVAAVRRVTERNLRDGYLVPEDAETTVRDAERSPIGSR